MFMVVFSFVILLNQQNGGRPCRFSNKKTAQGRCEEAPDEAFLRPIVLFKDWMVSNSPFGCQKDYSRGHGKMQAPGG
ncbi:MAG: hypothetical protein Q4F18_15105, partial [Clostridia bacterium]|nr:hypothetical protein [Clostridia bacterium]